MIKRSFHNFFSLAREAFNELSKNDPLRMAGATAFFTTFALPPILIILIQVLGLIFEPRTISTQLFEKLGSVVGDESVNQIVNTLKGFKRLAQSWYITIIGFVFLIFVATTLFKVIKSSLNQVWKIHMVARQTIWFGLGNRLRSIFIILVAGLLFLAGLLAESLKVLLGQYLDDFWPGAEPYLNGALSHVISVMIVTAWFAVLFRYLPDGKPKWNVALVGGLVTSLLFNSGKLLLRWLLSYSNINSLYGTSASVMLLLLFVFYSALILYYGAAFTKVWSEYKGEPITPLRHATHYGFADVKEQNDA